MFFFWGGGGEGRAGGNVGQQRGQTQARKKFLLKINIQGWVFSRGRVFLQKKKKKKKISGKNRALGEAGWGTRQPVTLNGTV